MERPRIPAVPMGDHPDAVLISPLDIGAPRFSKNWARRSEPTQGVDRHPAEGRTYSSGIALSNKFDSVEELQDGSSPPPNSPVESDTEMAPRQAGAGDQQAETAAQMPDRVSGTVEANVANPTPSEFRTQGHENIAESDDMEATHTSQVSDSDHLIWRKKYRAALNSIEFRGEMMRMYEDECDDKWFGIEGDEHDLVRAALWPRHDHATKAAELLEEFARYPIVDIADLLNAKWKGRAKVTQEWRNALTAGDLEAFEMLEFLLNEDPDTPA